MNKWIIFDLYGKEIKISWNKEKLILADYTA